MASPADRKKGGKHGGAGFASCSRPCELPVVPEECRQLIMGEDFTLLIAKDGLYSCGRGDSGQLGHGNRNNSQSLRKIKALASERCARLPAAASRLTAAPRGRAAEPRLCRPQDTAGGGVR